MIDMRIPEELSRSPEPWSGLTGSKDVPERVKGRRPLWEDQAHQERVAAFARRREALLAAVPSPMTDREQDQYEHDVVEHARGEIRSAGPHAGGDVAGSEQDPAADDLSGWTFEQIERAREAEAEMRGKDTLAVKMAALAEKYNRRG